jgi:hypothetical protein
MARRRQTRASSKSGRLTHSSTPSSPWPRVEELIECGGNITIGSVDPVPCAAVAANDYNMLAALVRRRDETFIELMQRLDAAIAKAIDSDEFTDEINSP